MFCYVIMLCIMLCVYIYMCIYIYIYIYILFPIVNSLPDRFLPFSLPPLLSQVFNDRSRVQRRAFNDKSPASGACSWSEELGETILLKYCWKSYGRCFLNQLRGGALCLLAYVIPMNYRLVCIIKPGWPSYWSYVYQLSHSKLGHCRSKMAQYVKYR